MNSIKNSFININSEILKCHQINKPGEPFKSGVFKKLEDNLETLSNDIVISYSKKEYSKKYSVAMGRVSSTPWIVFRSKKYPKNSFFISIIFIPKKNSILLAIQTQTKGYSSVSLLKQLKNFLDELYEGLKEKNGYTWENINPPFKNNTIIEKEPITQRTNSYTYGSCFYKYMSLNSLVNEEFEVFLSQLFSIFEESEEIFNEIKIDFKDLNITNIKDYNRKLIENIKNYNITLDEQVISFVNVNLKVDNNKNELKRQQITKTLGIEKASLSDKLNRQNETGKRAELIVEKYEREELIKANRQDLAQKVKVVAQDGLGYDVLSFDIEGNPKEIEVKGNQSVSDHFYISLNELNNIHNNERTMYIVQKVWNKNPEISWLDKENLHKENLIPVSFKCYFK